jgi:protein tyrosine phosphatase (PTP) superfamily phosphohydrolase (DUF442 family)
VIPQVLYRSAQLSAGRLERCVRAHGIRSVVNLRGANPQATWYQEEQEAALRLGVDYHDFSLTSRICPPSQEMVELIRLLDHCQTPVLLHCEAGTDRTGLGVAIWLLLEADTSLEDAERQLSLSYGCFPGRERTRWIHEFLHTYQEWLTKAGYAHTPQHFRQWACQTKRDRKVPKQVEANRGSDADEVGSTARQRLEPSRRTPSMQRIPCLDLAPLPASAAGCNPSPP